MDQRMRGGRKIKVVRGLSVIASSSFLVASAIGTAAAHPMSIVTSTGVDGDHAALAALICSYEPCDDVDELKDLIDEVLESWPDADDVARAMFEDHDEDADDESAPVVEAESDDEDDDHDGSGDDDDESASDESDDEDDDESESDESDEDDDESDED